MGFNPYRLYHKPPLRGGAFLAAVSPLEKLGSLPARVASMVAKHELKEEDGVRYAIYKRPRH